MNKRNLFPSTVLICVFSLVTLMIIGCGGSESVADKKTLDVSIDSAKVILNDSKESVAKKESTVENSKDVILCFGNSLTEALGVTPKQSYPHLIQQKIDSLGLEYKVVNAGISGETTSGGKGRLDWVLTDQVKVFILELGANDGLRGIDLRETEKNLQDMIDVVRAKNDSIQIIIAGMQIPPNLGIEYTNDFKNLFPALSEKNGTHLIPFLLEGVAGNPELNQADGIHPTVEGQKILAENVWEILKPILK